MDATTFLLRSAPVRRNGAGALSVEFALVAPLLILFLVGIIEFGLLFTDLLAVHQAAREGVRAAAVGATVAEVENRIRTTAVTLNPDNFSITLEFRPYLGGAWGNWMTLGDNNNLNPPQNDAPRGSQIRVRVTYPHQLATGALFSRIVGAEPDESGVATIDLRAAMLGRRE